MKLAVRKTTLHEALPHTAPTVIAVASIISIISASFALGITLVKTARQVRQASMLGLKTTLSEVLLRDGTTLGYYRHALS